MNVNDTRRELSMNDDKGRRQVDISIVIPLKDEEESLEELCGRLIKVLDGVGKSYELIFIDDGSTDGSFQILEKLHGQDTRIKVVQFRANFGKATALQAGFDVACGDIVFTMDADLQDDPKEIPLFLAKLDEGYDLVSGWKKKRQDPLTKILPSKLFNRVTALVSGIPLHDFNCGFKAYRREVLEHIELYGEIYRYIPVLVGWKGFKVSEITVEHHRRKYGKSKYGYGRLAKGFFDLLTILLITKYAKRPLHVFGTLGILCEFIGGLTLTYLTILWFMGNPIGNRPLLLFGVLCVLFGIQVISIGLVSEMVAKIDHRFEKGSVILKRLP